VKPKKKSNHSPAHLYGVPYQIEAIRAIADTYDIPILRGCC
jgi:dTDP-4-amino-4,6-dideoxygalactose transaminase